MNLGNWFWLFVVLAFVSWGWGAWQRQSPWAPYAYVPFIIPLAILGWKVFGPVVH